MEIGKLYKFYICGVFGNVKWAFWKNLNNTLAIENVLCYLYDGDEILCLSSKFINPGIAGHEVMKILYKGKVGYLYIPISSNQNHFVLFED